IERPADGLDGRGPGRHELGQFAARGGVENSNCLARFRDSELPAIRGKGAWPRAVEGTFTRCAPNFLPVGNVEELQVRSVARDNPAIIGTEFHDRIFGAETSDFFA